MICFCFDWSWFNQSNTLILHEVWSSCRKAVSQLYVLVFAHVLFWANLSVTTDVRLVIFQRGWAVAQWLVQSPHSDKALARMFSPCMCWFSPAISNSFPSPTHIISVWGSDCLPCSRLATCPEWTLLSAITKQLLGQSLANPWYRKGQSGLKNCLFDGWMFHNVFCFSYLP